MRALITGAAGMYGITLTRRLLRDDPGASVVAVDDFSRAFPGGEPLTPEVEAGKPITIVKRDYADLSTRELEHWAPDVIVHFAARVSVPESMDVPHAYFAANEAGTFRFAHAVAAMRRPPLLIYASSPEVYGAPTRTPMDEDHPMRPVTVYAVSKAASELHCMALHRWWGHPVIVIRNFNTFGPHQNVDGYPAVIATFVRRALRSQPLRLENGGRQTRDFMFVDDAVDAYARVIARGAALAGSVFNIGAGRERAIRDVARTVLDVTGSTSEAVLAPGRRADLPSLCADTRRIRKATGWRAATPFEEGLRRTAAWLRAVDR